MLVPAFVPKSPFHIPDEAVAVVVDATNTMVTGGTKDWKGRASIVRRADGVLVAFYRDGTAHAQNDGALHVRFSDDEGDNWTAEDTTIGGAAVAGFPMNPPGGGTTHDAGEPWAIVASSGDILLFMWDVDYGVTIGGTYKTRSGDGGESWTDPEQVTVTGLSTNGLFITDDGFVYDGRIYMAARVYSDADGDPSAVVLLISDDDGETIELLSTMVSTSDLSGHGTQECSLDLVDDGHGNLTIVALVRDDFAKAKGYKISSSGTSKDDLGLTWGTLTDITSEIGRIGRPRAYSRAFLLGLDDWQFDPVRLIVGFTFQTSGSSQPRRHLLLVSRDNYATFEGPFYLDAQTEDAGYGDVFIDRTTRQVRVWNYQGTLLGPTDLNQYECSIAGI